MKARFFIILSVIFYASNTFSNPLLQTPIQKLPLHNWAGFYGGLLIGGQFGRSSNKTAAFGYNADNDEWTYSESGLNAGAGLGYSYTWRQIIFGPEIDLGYLNLNGSGAQPASPGLDTIGKTKSNFYTTFRGRLGVNFDRYQLFATGGAIGINYKKQVIDTCYFAPCGGGTVNAQKNNFVWGYTAGGGIEHLFNHWSIKLECLYFNLNNQSFSGTTNLGNTYEWTGKTLGYIIRGGTNYYF